MFDKVHILAAHFSYDCLYHDFDVPVQASIIPGVHKVYVSLDSMDSVPRSTMSYRKNGRAVDACKCFN